MISRTKRLEMRWIYAGSLTAKMMKVHPFRNRPNVHLVTASMGFLVVARDPVSRRVGVSSIPNPTRSRVSAIFNTAVNSRRRLTPFLQTRPVAVDEPQMFAHPLPPGLRPTRYRSAFTASALAKAARVVHQVASLIEVAYRGRRATTWRPHSTSWRLT